MMKIYKDVPIPEPHAESKTAFVKDLQVGNSVLCSGGFHGKEVRRVTSAMRKAGFKATSRTESGHGKKAKIRIWRIEGSPTKGKPPKKVGKHTQAGKKGKIIQCPECSHRMVMSNFAWSKIVCLGCRAEIKKTDCLLPRLGKRQEAKVRSAYESEQTLDVDKPVKIVCKEHGGFLVTPNNHLGDNPEKIAYGCPKCSQDRVQQFCGLKAENLGCSLDDNPHEYITTFNALHDLLKTGKGQLASQIGEMSYEGIVALANDTRLDGMLKEKTNEHPIK
jgi:DNA-directed RNA polymerase subunit M/transcription elongation factor TFIIS